LKKRTGLDLALYLVRCSTVLICFFFAFGGHYPPAHAQRTRPEVQTVPVLTVEDAVQDNDIKAINQHLVATDGTVQRQWDVMTSMANDVSGMKAEQRVAEFIIGLIASSGVVLQLRKRV
jgi:hypothetical protein